MLVLFGLLVGLGASEIFLHLRAARQQGAGSEFADVEDLRRAMLRPASGSSNHTVTLGDLVQPHKDDKIIYELRPNLKLTFLRTAVRTNSHSMRGPEYAAQKPADLFRIALLGDSFTFGWGVEENQGFAEVMEQKLNQVKPGGRRFEVLNFGVPGYSTFQEVALYQERALEFNPDAALVFFVENDWGLPFFMRNLSQPQSLLPGSEFTRLVLNALHPQYAEENLRLKGLDPNRSLAKLSKLNVERGIRTWLSINPGPKADLDRKRLAVLNRRPEIRFFNLRPLMLAAIESNHIDPKDLTLPDDPHPSALKHRLLGELLTEQISAALTQETQAAPTGP